MKTLIAIFTMVGLTTVCQAMERFIVVELSVSTNSVVIASMDAVEHNAKENHGVFVYENHGTNSRVDFVKTVSIYSDMAGERKKNISIRAAADILRNIRRGLSVVSVVMVLRKDVHFTTAMPLLRVIEENIALDLLDLITADRFLADETLKRYGIEQPYSLR